MNLPAGDVVEGKKKRKAEIAARDRKISRKPKTNKKPKKEKVDEDLAALQAFRSGASKEKGKLLLLIVTCSSSQTFCFGTIIKFLEHH